MSLILEALRKSEAERRRGQAPDVAVELAPAAAPSRIDLARWLWPVLTLVTLFAAVPVIGIWWSTRSSPVPAPIPAPPLATRQAPPNAEMPVVQPRATPTPTPATAPAAPVVTTPPPAAPAVAAANAPPPPPAPAADPPAAVGMAGVKLSMHVWNDDPARRFVVLNGQRMLEGERNGDLLLVEVLRDGVLVERDGQRARIDLP